jgi:hypothetical protein
MSDQPSYLKMRLPRWAEAERRRQRRPVGPKELPPSRPEPFRPWRPSPGRAVEEPCYIMTPDEE